MRHLDTARCAGRAPETDALWDSEVLLLLLEDESQRGLLY